MNETNVKLNNEQFKALQNLVYLGKWMLEAHHDNAEDKFKTEEEVEQLIYAKADLSISEFDNELNKYFPTREFEDEMSEFIHEYDQFTFWEELAYQLADRDTKIELGDQFEKMSLRERIAKHHKYLEYYTQEFIKNGLNNLKIK